MKFQVVNSLLFFFFSPLRGGPVCHAQPTSPRSSTTELISSTKNKVQLDLSAMQIPRESKVRSNCLPRALCTYRRKQIQQGSRATLHITRIILWASKKTVLQPIFLPLPPRTSTLSTLDETKAQVRAKPCFCYYRSREEVEFLMGWRRRRRKGEGDERIETVTEVTMN